MTAFGHSGFGSSNRRNQLRAQGQIGGQDPYGNQVRNAMQPPTMTAYQAPAAYQQATGQQPTSQPATQQLIDNYAPTGGTNYPAPEQPPAITSGKEADDLGVRAVVSPGTAQPIQPQSQGTPLRQATAAPDYSHLTDAEYNDLRSQLEASNRYAVGKGAKPVPIPPARQASPGPSAAWAQIAQGAGPQRQDTVDWMTLEQNARNQFGEEWYQSNVSQPRQMSYDKMVSRRQELRDAGYKA